MAAETDNGTGYGLTPDGIGSTGMAHGTRTCFRHIIVGTAILEEDVFRLVDVEVGIEVRDFTHFPFRNFGNMAVGAGAVDGCR